VNREMNRFRVLTLLTALVVFMTAAGEMSGQVAGGTVTLTVRLRAVDGEPMAGEPVVLQRLPDEEARWPACRTDSTGTCSWQVTRGLYQVLFERPLDGVSALALAEGGLRGFGLTVGDEDITYHFTLQDDSRIYFDAAPEAARPAPIIPTPALLQGDVAPTATPGAQSTDAPEPVTAPEESGMGGDAGDAEAAADQTPWQLVLYLALGLTAGGGLHLVSRRRKRPAAGKEGKDA